MEEAVAEGAIGEAAGVFGDEAVGGGGGDVQAGHEVDGCAGAYVRSPGDAEDVGELGYAEGFGYATCPAYVGEEEVTYDIAVAVGFAYSDSEGGGLGEFAIAFVVFGEEGVFEPFDVA